MLYRFLLLLCTIGMAGEGLGQTFTVDTTFRYNRHEANDLVFYMNTPIRNHSGQDLALRFQRTIIALPASWTTNVQCVDSFYAAQRDSGRFWLPKDFTFNSLIACYFYPNQTLGRGEVDITIFNPQAPADSVTVTFVGETYFLTGSEALEQVYYQLATLPEGWQLQWAGKDIEAITLVDMAGRVIFRQPIAKGTRQCWVPRPGGHGIGLLGMSLSTGPTRYTKVVW